MTPVFHEKMLELDHLHEVPLLFLGGLSDEVLIRTGREMGIDEYMTNPVSDQTLLATIKDTIKRDRQIESRRKARNVALFGALEIQESRFRPPVHTNRTAGCPHRRGSGTSALSLS